jgi:hypothetical protein
MIAAEISVLAWRRMNTGSRRYSAVAPMSTLLTSYIV